MLMLLTGDQMLAAKSSKNDGSGLCTRHRRSYLDRFRSDQRQGEGRPTAGRRPALVVSSAAFTKNTGLAVVCPITSHVRPFPTSVVLPPGLPIAGEILTSHIRSIDTISRPIRYAGAIVPPELVQLVRAKLNTFITI